MTLKERLIQEIEHTPDILLEQVFNFLRFLKTNSLIQTSRSSRTEDQIQQLSDEVRLVRLNQLFGAWQDQPDLEENFTAVDRSRHAYRGRELDSLDD